MILLLLLTVAPSWPQPVRRPPPVVPVPPGALPEAWRDWPPDVFDLVHGIRVEDVMRAMAGVDPVDWELTTKMTFVDTGGVIGPVVVTTPVAQCVPSAVGPVAAKTVEAYLGAELFSPNSASSAAESPMANGLPAAVPAGVSPGAYPVALTFPKQAEPVGIGPVATDGERMLMLALVKANILTEELSKWAMRCSKEDLLAGLRVLKVPIRSRSRVRDGLCCQLETRIGMTLDEVRDLPRNCRLHFAEYLRRRRRPEAERVYRELLEERVPDRDGRWVPELVGLAELYQMQSKWTEAAETYLQAPLYTRDPVVRDELLLMGARFLLWTNQGERARQVHEQVARTATGDARAILMMDRVILFTSKEEKQTLVPEELLQPILAGEFGDEHRVTALGICGSVYYGQHNLPRAKDYLTKCRQLAATLPPLSLNSAAGYYSSFIAESGLGYISSFEQYGVRLENETLAYQRARRSREHAPNTSVVFATTQKPIEVHFELIGDQAEIESVSDPKEVVWGFMRRVLIRWHGPEPCVLRATAAEGRRPAILEVPRNAKSPTGR